MILLHFELSKNYVITNKPHVHIYNNIDQAFLWKATIFTFTSIFSLTIQHLRKFEFLTCDTVSVAIVFSFSHKTFGHRLCTKWWIKDLLDSSFHVSIQTRAWWVENILWAVLFWFHWYHGVISEKIIAVRSFLLIHVLLHGQIQSGHYLSWVISSKSHVVRSK